MEINRRAFLSKLGAASVGVGVTGLAGCKDSNNSSAPSGCPLETYSAVGDYSYDEDSRELVLTVTDSGFPIDCEPRANDEQTLKVRGVMNDAMYWLVESADRERLLQWVRLPVQGNAIEGVWTNNYGYTLTLADNNQFELSFTGCGCATYGFAGIGALAENPFQQGVVSGEPSSRGFIIWTRDDRALNSEVFWEVATDPLFENRIKSGQSLPVSRDNYTLKETVTGLSADTLYYYRFSLGSDLEGVPYRSMVGRIKTLPESHTPAEQLQLKLAVVSCASYPHGFFVAYRNVARRDDLDYVLHLGDYIYEYEETEYGNPEAIEQGRHYAEGNRKEILNLEDYRARYKRYREDTDLQMLHSRYGFITTWDDHETADNSWDPVEEPGDGGAVNHNEGEGPWEDRKAAGVQVYNEWMPIADITDYHNPEIYRSFLFGRLMELLMLDTRIQGRHQQADIEADSYGDPDRRIISQLQESWLKDRLSRAQTESTARTWKILGQQVQMAPVQAPPLFELFEWSGGEYPSSPPASPEWANVLNTDTWDGYSANRQAVWDHIVSPDTGETRIDNVVVLTGDIHTSWAAEMQNAVVDYDPITDGQSAYVLGPKYGVEFVTPSITSPGLEGIIPDETAVLAAEEAVKIYNPHIKYANLSKRGYVILEVTEDFAQASWYHMDSILDPENDTEELAEQYHVVKGSADLKPGSY